MKTYSTDNGTSLYRVYRSRDLIRKLRAESWGGPASSKAQWMSELATRVQQTTGKIVRTDTDTHFVNDLIAAQLIKEETNG